MPSGFRIALTLLLVAAPAASERPPNVVLIMADDVGYECFGAYGSKQYKTPVLDKLADSGARFTNAFSTPLCTPSRVQIMTGRYGVRNYLDFGVLDGSEYTFADLMKKAGYATAIAGKWQLHGSKNKSGTPPSEAGFDTYCLWNTPITGRRRYWQPFLDLNGKLAEVAKDTYGPDRFADHLIEFIARNRERPFFAYYPMALVHSPFLPTPASADRNSTDQQKNFEDMVAYADKTVGRIVAALDKYRLTRNTVVFFTGDNGTHRRITSRLNGRTIRGGKGTTTDAGTHVPLIVYAPGLIPGGRVLDDLVDFTDFLPTLADIARVEPPEGVVLDGRSFWPQLKGEKGDPREWSYCYYFPRPYAEKFDNAYAHKAVRFTRDKRFKLYGDGRLYDLSQDIEEKAPIAAGEQTPEAAAARGKLQQALDSLPARAARIPQRRE